MKILSGISTNVVHKNLGEFQILLKSHLDISTLKSGAQNLGEIQTICKSRYINSEIWCTMFMNFLVKKKHSIYCFCRKKDAQC